MSKIKNIIFDLGGVIINLNFGAIEKAFQKLLGDDYQTTFQELQTKNIFNKFEVGQLSEEEFLTFFTRTGKATPKEAAEAWHSILSDVPAYRLEVLKSLGQRYNIYLLSNTNYTHVQRIERDLLKIHGVKDFRGDFFCKGLLFLRNRNAKTRAKDLSVCFGRCRIDCRRNHFY